MIGTTAGNCIKHLGSFRGALRPNMMIEYTHVNQCMHTYAYMHPHSPCHHSEYQLPESFSSGFTARFWVMVNDKP